MWDSTTLINRSEAIAKIMADAKAKGYQSFKVMYDGQEIVTPSSLPEQVDMSKVSIANKLNNA